jgi:hypothetical protein
MNKINTEGNISETCHWGLSPISRKEPSQHKINELESHMCPFNHQTKWDLRPKSSDIADDIYLQGTYFNLQELALIENCTLPISTDPNGLAIVENFLPAYLRISSKNIISHIITGGRRYVYI